MTRADMNKMLWIICFVTIVMVVGMRADAVGLDIPFPQLKYEESTVGQDQLARAIRRLDNQTVEEAKAAADVLSADQSAPLSLRSWAAARKYEWLVGPGHNRAALEFGRAWLRENPEDPNAILWRRTMQQVAILFRQEMFNVDAEAIMQTSEDLFNNHPETAWEVIRGRLDYAYALKSLLSGIVPDARAESERQRTLAKDTLRRMIDAQEPSLSDKTGALQLLDDLEKAEKKRAEKTEESEKLAVAYMEKAQTYLWDLGTMTPDEAVKRRKELEELFGGPLPPNVPKAVSEPAEPSANP